MREWNENHEGHLVIPMFICSVVNALCFRASECHSPRDVFTATAANFFPRLC